MSDIVERLRNGEPCLDPSGARCRVMDAKSGCLCAEAADTITALRADVERLRAALNAWDAAVRVDVKMQGPQYAGVGYKAGRDAWEMTRAVLAGEPAPSPWRPIETAPKDGSEILAVVQGENRHWYGVAFWYETQSKRDISRWSWNYSIRPTHWMPLPEAPK